MMVQIIGWLGNDVCHSNAIWGNKHDDSSHDPTGKRFGPSRQFHISQKRLLLQVLEPLASCWTAYPHLGKSYRGRGSTLGGCRRCQAFRLKYFCRRCRSGSRLRN